MARVEPVGSRNVSASDRSERALRTAGRVTAVSRRGDEVRQERTEKALQEARRNAEPRRGTSLDVLA